MGMRFYAQKGEFREKGRVGLLFHRGKITRFYIIGKGRKATRRRERDGEICILSSLSKGGRERNEAGVMPFL